MIVELGHYALVLAFAAAALQCAAPAIGAARGWADLMRVGETAAAAQCALVALSFAALIHAFLVTDLSVTLVYQHSSLDKPTPYKVAGVWANHEGSMLLWALMLALFGGLVAVFGRGLPTTLRARVLSVQGAVSLAFLGFILFTSSPFARWPDGMSADFLRGLLAAQGALPGLAALQPQLETLSAAELMEIVVRFGDAIRLPPDGRDLNPVLQDPGLALHPPILYIGYVGLSIAYSFAIAALWEGKVDAAWARWVRPWTLFAWIALTLGIALGSYWAYYELGWGGWWFWDPVENASFMPWLAATALLHSAIVVEKRGELKSWTVLLAIIAFSFSLFGAFIVRSGVLDSVHAFASDPTRGSVILGILAFFVGGALWLYARRASELASHGLFAPISREAALLLNNALLTASLAAVLIGTMAPIAADAFGVRLTVGPPFFNVMMAAFCAPLLLTLPLGAATPWKRGDAAAVAERMLPAAILALAAAGAAAAAFSSAAPMADARAYLVTLFGSLIGAWAVFGALYEPLERARIGAALRGRASIGETLRRLRATPLSLMGKALAHAGLGVFALGAALSDGFESEDIRVASAGDRIAHGGVEFVVETIGPVEGPNYVATQAVVTIYDDGAPVATVRPEQRRYLTREETTTEVGLSSGLLRDFYVVLGEQRASGGFALRTEVKPLVAWIWLGCIVMALGGACSLADRRLRVGAPTMRKAVAASAAALLALGAAAAPSPALAIDPEEQFEDRALERRARALFEELRCMVCDNQSVDDSDAPLAKDIRGFARAMIAEGKSDAEIKAQLASAYGSDILMSPPLGGWALLVWALPILALLTAALLALRRLGRAPPASGGAAAPSEAPLTEEESAALKRILSDDARR